MPDLTPPGLPDDAFVCGGTPMTKAEVRAVTFSKARLAPNARVLDIGAGTGSLTIEAALLCPQGEVVAVERDPEALEVLHHNIERFGLSNVTIVSGEAPVVLNGHTGFDCALIGGSGGRLGDLLDRLLLIVNKGGRVVANTICLETTATIAGRLRREPWIDFECVQVAVSRGVPAGPLLRFEALNPVWVTAATLDEFVADEGDA